MGTEAIDYRQTDTYLELEAARESADTFATRYIPPIEWEFEGWWVKGGQGLITGKPKSRKSTLALDLAVSIAYNVPFLGHVAPHEDGASPVLVIQEELDDSELQSIVQAIMVDRGIAVPATKHEGFDLVSDRGYMHNPYGPVPKLDFISNQSFNLFDGPHIDFLKDVIAEGGYKYLILDPLYFFMGQDADLNSSTDMTTLLTIFKKLKKDTGCSVIIVHHNNRGNRYLGSTILRGWHQCWLNITKKADDVSTDVKFEFRGAKSGSKAKIFAGGVGQWTIGNADDEDDATLHKLERIDALRGALFAHPEIDIRSNKAQAMRDLKAAYPNDPMLNSYSASTFGRDAKAIIQENV